MGKKEEILKLLNEEGEMVETNIACFISLNKPYTFKNLTELKKEGKVILREEEVANGKRRYWKLKEE